MKGILRKTFLLHLGLVTIFVACGCREAQVEPPGKGGASAQPVSKRTDWPGKDDPLLADGRSIWIENCRNCHGVGKAGSPKFGDVEAWAPRLKKGEAALIASALNGFGGDSEGGMPPRGGEEDLTDAEVTSAVKYMIRFSSP